MKRPQIEDFEIGNIGPEETPYNYFEYVKALEVYVNHIEGNLKDLLDAILKLKELSERVEEPPLEEFNQIDLLVEKAIEKATL